MIEGSIGALEAWLREGRRRRFEIANVVEGEFEITLYDTEHVEHRKRWTRARGATIAKAAAGALGVLGYSA